MKPQTRLYRSEADWQKIIDQQADSNLPVSTFCEQQGIRYQSFYRWRKRLEVSATPEAVNMIDITSVVAIDPSVRWHIELDLGDGIKFNLKQA